MYKQSHVTVIARRAFAKQLLGLGIGAALVGYANATPVPIAQAVQAPQEPAQGYRLTSYVARYYQAARF